MRYYGIAVIPGDGIGQEVVPAALTVLHRAGEVFGFRLETAEYPWGCEYYLRHGEMMPADGLRQLEPSQAILLGAVGLPERARAIGEQVMDRFRGWAERFPLVGEARGLGAMNALELVRNRQTREPAPDEATAVVRHCYEHGLILIKCGSHNHVLRFLAPLAITDAQLQEGLDILEGALAAVQAASI